MRCLKLRVRIILGGNGVASTKPDQSWDLGASAEEAPLYYLPSRSEPYLVKIGTKFVRVQILVTGLLPEPELDVMEKASPVVAAAIAEPRGRRRT